MYFKFFTGKPQTLLILASATLVTSKHMSCVLAPGQYYPISTPLLGGKCLDVPNTNTGTYLNNTPVEALVCPPSPQANVWLIDQVDPDGFYKLKHAGSGFYLHVGSDDIGAPVVASNVPQNLATSWRTVLILTENSGENNCSINTPQGHIITLASFFGPQGNAPSLADSSSLAEGVWKFHV